MDHALGSLLGVAVGDAAGAPLEHAAYKRIVEPRLALAVMRMPGLNRVLGKGQGTDDTELTICLARGLAGHPPSAGFPAEAVADEYSHWFAVGAFGGGRTCKTAFSARRRDRCNHDILAGQGASALSEDAPLASKMQAIAQAMSKESKANGALMRVAPLAVWGHRLNPDILAQHAATDASLSHPNPTCADCSAAYCIAVAHLIANPGDTQGALAAACDWASQHAGEEARQWLLHDSLQPLEQVDCLDSPGFVKHAFTLAFCHLRRQTPFAGAICQTLCRGGDTDTNAAIVGGLMGALHGAAAIPDFMVLPVLAYEGREEQGGGCPRPESLWAAGIPDLARQLFELAGK